MPLLLLIRHGENDYSKKGRLAGRLPGIHLNELGRSQAQELAVALAKAPIQAIYSSPLERARETAQPIAAALDLNIQLDPGLIESDVGEWQGKSVRRLALSRYWRIIQHAPSRAAHPGGESFIQTQTRVVAALESVCARHKPRGLVACVFHADPIKLAVAHFIGLPLDRFQRLACDTASVTLLAVGPGSAQLLSLNRRAPFEFPSTRSK
jgi:probable phosphomutase (TIGR03848 family)